MAGGAPWHAVHESGRPVVLVQATVAAVPLPPGKLPWQYVLAQVSAVVFHEPPVPATPPKATVTTPFACCGVVGTAPLWHSAQSAWREREPATCVTCAPTPRDVTAELFWVSTGGAAATFASAPVLPAVPWHSVQFSGTTSMVPLMCVATLTELFV
jgi:hypothetical protein